MSLPCKPEWKVTLELLQKVDPELLNRLTRRMIYYLYTRHAAGIDNLIKELEPTFSEPGNSDNLYSNMPHPKKDIKALETFVHKVFQIAGETILDQEISDQLAQWLVQERSRFLSISAGNANISLLEIRDALNRYFNMDPDEVSISPNEFINIRVSLIRRFLTDDLHFVNIAKNHCTARCFSRLLKNVIGPARGTGKLGGKSVGMIIANEVINTHLGTHPEFRDIRMPESWFITSDTMMDFIHYNALEEMTSIKYQDLEEIRAGYPFLQQLFKHSFFTGEIINQLNTMLDQIGDSPIIVRSSSLLEDSFGAAFSGKYKSLFLTNTGSQSERLNKLLDAIAEIFASVFSPDPIEYRKERGLIDFNEDMAILIQKVVGRRHGHYYFPLFAGVAFSHNEFPWSPRVERNDGVVRMVMGLGTRAVDRVGDDYPFMISPGKPEIPVSSDAADVFRYSQRKMDILDIKNGRFETVPVKTVLKEHVNDIHGISHIVSCYQDDHISTPMGILLESNPEKLFVSFQGLVKNTSFIKNLKSVIDLLGDVFESPVDVEFASDGDHLYLLQCRPQCVSESVESDTLPADLLTDRILFRADKHITRGTINNIEYVVYIDPEHYLSLPELSLMKQVSHAVSKLNKILPGKRFILIGPGRWGSRGDIRLGVPVTYSDINNTAALIEVAFEQGGYIPELSFGTHFFQDLVESNIRYIPIYLQREGGMLNRKMIHEAPNRLSELAEEFSHLEQVIRVIKISDLVEKHCMKIIMDADNQIATAFIDPDSLNS